MHVAQPPQTVDRVRGCQSSSDPPGPPHSPMTQVHPPRSSWPARRHQAAARSPRPHCAAASKGGVRATHPQRRNNSSAGRPPPSPTPAWSTTGHARAGCAGRRGRQSARDKTRAPPWSGALATRRSPPLHHRNGDEWARHAVPTGHRASFPPHPGCVGARPRLPSTKVAVTRAVVCAGFATRRGGRGVGWPPAQEPWTAARMKGSGSRKA